MKYKKANLKPDEKATLNLRGLYEQFGYKKYKMGRFEEYSLYVENKDFLASDKVITFTDLDGRLLALKPDVTLSIIKNSMATRQKSEKLYYIENVYRESKESHTYKEISQMGLEYIGDVDQYGIVEVVALAVSSLRAISPDYILEISHMSFVVELLESLDVSVEIRHKLLRLIRSKNVSAIRRTAEQTNLSAQQIASLCKIPTLYGDVAKTLKEAGKLALNKEMEAAISELSEIYQALKALGCAKNVQIDFSMVNDIDYYNGIIFRGYIKELARSVLAGGQYDSAMDMFGKDVGAMGFALYLNEISQMIQEPAKYDVDAVILYEEGTNMVKLVQEVQRLQREGLSVRVDRSLPENLRYQCQYLFNGEEAVKC